LPIKNPRALWVLFVSGVLGFRIGMSGFPDWQVAVETSQVLAGLVKYPPGNPFFIYHIRLWTILHQLLAPLLALGISEIRLSLIVSGLLGMVTFQALSMVVYALSRDFWLAVGAAAFIFFTRAAEYGGVYGLFLLGTENTYGILGMSFCLLAVAMIAAGSFRAGAFLLAVAPAVHPSLGVWTGAIVACALIFDLQALRGELRPAWRWFFIGCLVTLISLAVQLVIIYRAPHAAASGGTSVAFSTSELTAFIRFWDGHRRPVDIGSNGVWLNFGALAMAALWLRAFKDDLPRPSLFLLRFVAVSAVLSLAMMCVSWIPPERLPATLLVLMPGRLMNFDALVYAAMLIGLLGAYRRWWSQTLLVLLLVGLFTGGHSMLWEWLRDKRNVDIFSPVEPLWFLAGVPVALAIGAVVDRKRGRASFSPKKQARPLLVGTLGMLFAATVLTLTFSRPRALLFHDRTNDVFFGQVAADRGMLLTAGDLHLIQLKTRRPVLLDGGGLDGVMYSLEAGPEMKRILRDVYGVDLLNPPEEARGAGRIPPIATQKVWEHYSTEKWRELGRSFGVTQVLTYPDWTLNLPLAAQSRRYLLYRIPE
jgi:hypothetical protein